MDDKGDTRQDLKIPEGELGQKIREDFSKDDVTVIVSCRRTLDSRSVLIAFHAQVTVMAAVGEEAIIASKNATN